MKVERIEVKVAKEAIEKLLELVEKGDIAYVSLIALVDKKAADVFKIFNYQNSVREEGVEIYKMAVLCQKIAQQAQELRESVEKASNMPVNTIIKNAAEFERAMSSNKSLH